MSAEGNRVNSSYDNASGLYPQGTDSDISWNSLYNKEVIGNPCPDGYRAPNLRELMLMYTTYPDLFEDDFGGTYSFYLSKTGFSFDTPDAIDLDLMKKHLVALKEGLSVKSPRYDFVTCESDPNGDEKKPAKVILTEGLYVLNEGVRDIMDVKVYVFTPLEVIKERWYKRAKERGKTGEAADLQFADVNHTAQQYIRPTYQIADAVINGLVSQEYIQEITDKIFKALKTIVC